MGDMDEEDSVTRTQHNGPTVAVPAGRVVYICCGLIYAVLCVPAINARGYPPIDPGWLAVPFLWVAAIPLSLVFDARPFKKRFKGLAIYCLVTAFFDAGTAGGVVPRHVTLPGMLVMTIVYGPMHLVVGMFVERLSQGIGGAARSILKRLWPGNIRLVQWLAFVVLVLLTCGFPFAFRAYSIADSRHRGRTQAEKEWNAGRAEMYVAFPDFSGDVQHRFDPVTGLKIRERGYMSEYSLAYQARVAELLAKHGIPEWSMKKYIPADVDLVAMFDSKKMEKIKAFPHNVNENIILTRQGTVTRWNTTFSNISGFLAIATPQAFTGVGAARSDYSRVDGRVTFAFGGGDNSYGPQNEPVFVGRLPKYPQVIFVRSGTDWIGAFHQSGELLSSADRSKGTFGRPSIMER